jgi:TolB protein
MLLGTLGAGCAQMCSVGGSSQHAQTKASRPAAFPEQTPETAGPAHVVNIFGEVNGARQRGATPVTEVGFQQHTFTDEGYDSDVSVDPTGKWLAFSSTRNSEHPSIYLQRVDGTAVTQLTSDADDDYPVFSPDGKQIAFSSTRAGTWNLFVMDVDGRNVTQITNGTSQAIHPSYSPDGSRLVFCSLGSRSGQWELWTVSLKTGERRMIGYGLFPSWSPDRGVDRIAFQRARQRGSRWFSLWTLDLINGESRRVTEVAVSTNAAIISPAWSPDGKRLAFTTVLEPASASSTRLRGQTDVWTIDAGGGGRQRLTDGRATNLTPYWASDNRLYFISDRGGVECIWSVRAEVEQTAPTIVRKDVEKKEAPAKEQANKEPSVVTTDEHEVAH